MSAITSLRGVIEGATNEAEYRILGVLQAIESAMLTFVSAIFVAVEVSARQIVQVFFDLTQTMVRESFNVIDAVAAVALGEVEDEDIDEKNAEAGVTASDFIINEEVD